MSMIAEPQRVEHLLGRTYTKTNNDGSTVEVPGCDKCGFPVGPDGLTTQRPLKVGDLCKKCGRRQPSPAQLAAWQSNGQNLQPAKPKGDPRSDEIRMKAAIGRAEGKRRRGESTVAALIRQKAEEKAEKVVAPFFAALELAPDPGWSNSTKLKFFMDQTIVAGRVMDRVDGMPIARQRNVDAEDNDVIPDHVPPDVIDQFIGSMVDKVLAQMGTEDGAAIEDAEFELLADDRE